MKSIKSSNKKAETLLELVIVLFLLSLIIFESSAMLKNFTGFTKDFETKLELEDDINLFFSFMENDFKLYSAVSVKSDSIHFEQKNSSKLKSCDYFIYDDRIKRVAGSDYTGNTYFLKGIQEMNFRHDTEANFVILDIKINDKAYRKIFSLKDIEVIEWREQVHH